MGVFYRRFEINLVLEPPHPLFILDFAEHSFQVQSNERV
jgi:hypothetical protein